MTRDRCNLLKTPALLCALLAAGGLRAQDPPENSPAQPPARGDSAAREGRFPEVEESGKSGERRRGQEGEEELPAEFQPERIIPFQQSQVELPDWRGEEPRALPGQPEPADGNGGLFPPRIWPVPAVEAPERAPRPARAESAPPALEPGKEPPAAPLSPELREVYFARRPDRVFVDPQHLLDEEDAREMEGRVRRWMNTECAFKTTLLVFAPGQTLPPEADADALMRKWFNGSPDALLVFYFYQQPERTRAVFAPGAAGRFPAERLKAAMASAIQQAGQESGGLEQLERFCYKTTVLLHDLAKSRAQDGLPAAGDTGSGAWGWVWAAAGAGALTGGALMIRKRLRSREKPELPPVLLPEQDFHTRLGAPHCGGFSAVLTFPADHRQDR